MMECLASTTALLGLALLFIALASLWRNSKRQILHLPPGPTPLPILGNMLQLNPKELLNSLLRLGNTYGAVFTVYFGPRPIVMLYGYETVKEALVDNKEDFVSRGILPVHNHILKGYGITMSNGERWRQMRRFAIMTLRNFGMGKRSIEERIQEEAQFLVEEIKSTQGIPFDPTFVFGNAVSNIICSIVFGNRYDYEDKKFLALLTHINELLRFMNSTWDQVFSCFPHVMKYLPGPHHSKLKHLRDLRTFVEERTKVHEETLDLSSPRDFIDCFLIKMNKEKENPDTEFHNENLVSSTVNLFFAGTETVSTTLRYGILILLKYPEIREKMQQEIDRVIGHNRFPSVEDRSKMQYTDAVIHEIQRFSDIIPTGLPHTVTRDIQFRGYTIPKGVDVYPLLTTVLRDDSQFKNPEHFSPTRFLDENGCLVRKDAFMPFSAGKRMCPGEGLARMELFVFFTTILQKFNLKPVTCPEDIDLSPDGSTSGRLPRPYQLIALPR
ncbi:cytochrome P450 2C18-like [Ambystoma mexicanum]|uniref:cytochrome P450 2C18-like n=1 Tax=Ambystoma mexicanum TaxID=8296 RepID=UPI0037E8100B